jgi:2-oxoglutarate dehydrogenase E1 component
VALDEVIAEIETDKVTVEVRAAHAGVITEALAAEGDTVDVGAPLVNIDTAAAAPEGAAATPAPAAAAAAPAAPAPSAAPSAPKPAPAAAAAAKPPPPAAASPGAGGASETFLTGSSAAYVDDMFAAWCDDPSSVHPSWASYFKQVGSGAPAGMAHATPPSISGQPLQVSSMANSGPSDTARVLHLIQAYQKRGHEIAQLDPLGQYNWRNNLKVCNENTATDLDYKTYGFTDADWTRPLNLTWGLDNVAGLLGNADVNNDGQTTLEEIHNYLNLCYTGTVAVEFGHITDLEQTNWLRSRVEVPPPEVSKAAKSKNLERLAESEKFEALCATKFNAAKRFGLEGCESLIPGMKAMVDTGTEMGVKDVVIGMPHRGRLNVLGNIIEKPLQQIFKEFKGTDHEINESDEGDWSSSGDVKYHLGTSFDRRYPDGRQVHLALLPNPSHLETVNPIVNGKARARMHLAGDQDGNGVLPVVLHGDGAFAGQGIVYETMQLCHLDFYTTGGTINIICNNQVAFTADPEQGRSTMYASDLGKAFNCPIFHVNADDTEAVVRIFKMATEWRQTFHTDVIIDLIGYRRHGHNEIDEPTFTQPSMYGQIKAHPTVLDIYSNQLVSEGSLTQDEVNKIISDVTDYQNKCFDESDSWKSEDLWGNSVWSTMKGPTQMSSVEKTSLDEDTFDKVAQALHTTPDGFNVHPKLKRQIKQKAEQLTTGQDIDWATGEALAFGSLLLEGNDVRLSGQDVERGTFSHRHCAIRDQKTGEKHVFVNGIDANQPRHLQVMNSPLIEYAVLGFELGYSMETPHQLVMWEAQFGDFVNGAQIVIDQYISSMEAKWLRQTGLVLSLPHGHQGAGPEHSSCRIERFLQSSDEDPEVVPPNMETIEGQIAQTQRTNWQVMNITTPANYFHALRRQLHREFRKPLILAQTKALLRHKLAVSSKDEFIGDSRFHRVYPEQHAEELTESDKMRKVVMCSGKIYYELLEKRRAGGVDDVALIRLEQLSPFPFDHVAKAAKDYPNAELVWAQEEPKNMGYWYFVQERINTATRVINGEEKSASYVGRKTMASPAEGYGDVHTYEQNKILDKAMS